MLQVDLSGTVDLRETLFALSKATRNKIGLEAVITALTPIVDTAQQLAPVDTANLKESIGFRAVKFKNGNITAIIGPRRKFKKGNRIATKYGHLAEHGHVGRDGKFVPGKPFMRPSFDQNVDRALKEIGTVLGTKIEAQAKRLSRKRAKLANK